MTRVLVKFERDWADEFNVYGLAIMTVDAWAKAFAYFSEPRNFQFGSNEGFDDEILAEDMLVISTDENVIKTFESTIAFYSEDEFGKTWGQFPYLNEH